MWAHFPPMPVVDSVGVMQTLKVYAQIFLQLQFRESNLRPRDRDDAHFC